MARTGGEDDYRQDALHSRTAQRRWCTGRRFDVALQPKAVRRRIGLVFQEQTLDDRLTADQNLRFHAAFYHVPRGEVEQRIDQARSRGKARLILCGSALHIAPNEPELVGGTAAQVWADCADTVSSRIYGPHLEDLAREWCLRHASAETLGGRPSAVAPAAIACAQHRQGHELDVVVISQQPHAAPLSGAATGAAVH